MECEKYAKYYFYGDIGLDYRDSGRWRSYELDTCGDTLDELRENATIAEVDQDGGEINCYGYLDIPNNEVENAFERIVNDLLMKG